VLYAVGLGVLPGVATGQQVNAAAAATGATISINGATFDPLYAGAAPGFTGLDQINVAIPSSLSSGKTTISVGIDGQQSPPITVWLQ
jgi:uncharacterized protein (TIGR03437 family)